MFLFFRYPIYRFFLFFLNLPYAIRAPKLVALSFFLALSSLGTSLCSLFRYPRWRDQNNFTQGESSYYAMARIMAHLNLRPDQKILHYGSGLGLSCFFIAIYYGLPVKGIEIQSCLVQLSKWIQKLLRVENLEFIHADFLVQDVDDVSVLFIPSTCFSQDLLKAISKRIVHCKPETYVVSLSTPISSPFLDIVKTLRLPQTWGYAHVYVQKTQKLR